jgi:hypothetical protein
MKKVYLGDAVYAEWLSDRAMLKLTVEYGLMVTDTIYLELATVAAINDFLTQLAADSLDAIAVMAAKAGAT